MLQKFYDGRQDHSFAEILSQGADEFGELLKTMEQELSAVPELDDQARKSMSEFFGGLPAMMREQYRSFAGQIDDEIGDASVKKFEQASGLGQKVLKNIRKPDVLAKCP